MVGRSGKIVRCQELKTLIRQGIPHEYREEVWKGWVLFWLSFLSLSNPLCIILYNEGSQGIISKKYYISFYRP